ncbi:hypothetical protein SRIMM317S_06368 [Streptomyces rimosus subsp. rimosus]
MGLTSQSLEIMVVMLAVACVVLTVWQWPRLSRRGVPAVLGRLGPSSSRRRPCCVRSRSP